MEPSFRQFRDECVHLAKRQVDNVVVFRRVDSTNLIGRRVVDEFLREGGTPPGSLLVAFEQGAGRGRQGRSWMSPPGLGVYASLLVPVREPGTLPTLPLLVGIGLCRGLEPHLARPPRLKWPNDVFVQDRKLGGVLIEVVSEADGGTTAIVGFGINHGQGPGEMPLPSATSVRVESTSLPSLGRLTVDVAKGVQDELEHIGETDYAIEGYRRLSMHRPGDRLQCRLGGTLFEGEFLGFSATGHLRLGTAKGETLLAAGEVLEG